MGQFFMHSPSGELDLAIFLFRSRSRPCTRLGSNSVIRSTALLILVSCLCRTLAFAQTEFSGTFPSEIPEATALFPNSFAGINGAQTDSTAPLSKVNFALEFGRKWLEVKASYFEKRIQEPALLGSASDPMAFKWLGKYADLLAVSSQFGGRLVGEAQAAYSTLGVPPSGDHLPMMTRLGVHGRWEKLGYGLSTRSSGRGYVSPAGVKTEHARDESQIWAEYDLGQYRVRGAVGEMWEDNFDTRQLTLTRMTATSLYLNKPSWNAALSSSYSTVANNEHLEQKTLALTHELSFAYRFTSLLTLEPNVRFKQEWAPITSLKTDTCSAGFGLTYAPSRDLQWIGRASYARDSSEDPLRAGSLLSAATGLNWKLGKTFLGEQSVSLQLEYRNESRLTVPDNQQASLTGTIQFKILGF